MSPKKNVFAIIGSASQSSSNEALIDLISNLTIDVFNLTIQSNLKALPPFDPELSINNPPAQIIQFRNEIEAADAVLICTPEYIFSIPSGLKNVLEWCVSTTVFSAKPVGLITASADGRKGHEELQLIMKTMMANFTEETTLLIQGIKGKIDTEGNLLHEKTRADLMNFIAAFKNLIGDTGR